MKLSRLLPALAVGALALTVAFAQDVYQPLPSVENPYIGHGGGRGRGGPRVLNDMELTVITRASESVEVLNARVTAARDELSELSLTLPVNLAAMRAATERMASAEVELALARADTYSRLKGELGFTNPTKVNALANALNN